MTSPSGDPVSYVREQTRSVLYSVDEHVCDHLTDLCVATIDWYITHAVTQSNQVHLFEPHPFRPANETMLTRAAVNESLEASIRENNTPRGNLALRVVSILETRLPRLP